MSVPAVPGATNVDETVLTGEEIIEIATGGPQSAQTTIRAIAEYTAMLFGTLNFATATIESGDSESNIIDCTEFTLSGISLPTNVNGLSILSFLRSDTGVPGSFTPQLLQNFTEFSVAIGVLGAGPVSLNDFIPANYLQICGGTSVSRQTPNADTSFVLARLRR